jgi:hypothetical protein
MTIHVLPEGLLARNLSSIKREDTELLEAWRAVANAKLVEFRNQAFRLALLSAEGVIRKSQGVDRLYTIAIAHGLVRALGDDHVQAIIAEPFAIRFSGEVVQQ